MRKAKKPPEGAKKGTSRRGKQPAKKKKAAVKSSARAAKKPPKPKPAPKKRGASTGGDKTDSATMEYRIEQVRRWLVRGASRADVLQIVAKIDANPKIKSWGVSVRTIDLYIQRAREQINDTLNRKRRGEASKAIQLYDECIRVAMDKGDIRAALLAQKDKSIMLRMEKGVPLEEDLTKDLEQLEEEGVEATGVIVLPEIED